MEELNLDKEQLETDEQETAELKRMRERTSIFDNTQIKIFQEIINDKLVLILEHEGIIYIDVDDFFSNDKAPKEVQIATTFENTYVLKFQQYFHGRLVRFLDHDDTLYVDAGDLHLLVKQPTIN